MRRLLACVEAWPECAEGQYNPACCRFPKSCSCTVYEDDIDPSLIEPHNIVSWIESGRKGWFQCSCGEQFVTEGYDSEAKSMGALIVQHQAANGSTAE